jgi:dUTPase
MPPKYGGNGGIDIFMPSDRTIEAGDEAFIDMGVALQMPQGYALEAKLKPSFSHNHRVMLNTGFVGKTV